jgi:hypothetical protein
VAALDGVDEGEAQPWRRLVDGLPGDEPGAATPGAGTWSQESLLLVQ